jgi:hypothetical protein
MALKVEVELGWLKAIVRQDNGRRQADTNMSNTEINSSGIALYGTNRKGLHIFYHCSRGTITAFIGLAVRREEPYMMPFACVKLKMICNYTKQGLVVVFTDNNHGNCWVDLMASTCSYSQNV